LDERGKFVDQPTKLDPDKPGRWINEDEIKWFNDSAGLIQKESDPEKRLLLASAHHLDDAIGRIVAALDKTGQRENTLILFSSDNGPQGSWKGDAYPDDLELTDFNQPLPMRGKKVDVWEGGIHVPGFANWPGRIEAKEVTDIVHIIDWFPTLANQIGYDLEEDIAWGGVDISCCIFEDESIPDRDLYWVWNSQENRWAVRYGDWKVVKYGKGVPGKTDWELYDLQNDPKEETNLAGAKPEMVSELHQRFLQHRRLDKRSGKK
jgi:arylsulfatase A-like enzyme